MERNTYPVGHVMGTDQVLVAGELDVHKYDRPALPGQGGAVSNRDGTQQV